MRRAAARSLAAGILRGAGAHGHLNGVSASSALAQAAAASLTSTPPSSLTPQLHTARAAGSPSASVGFGAAAVAACALAGGAVLADTPDEYSEVEEGGWGGRSYAGGEKPEDNPYTHPDPKQLRDSSGLPIQLAVKSAAHSVPPPCNRSYPVHLVVEMETTTQELSVSPLHKYVFWTFDGRVPGPMIRCRVGDVLEVRYTNKDRDGVGHNIDFHAVMGPGGGATALYAEEGETKVATFKILYPGLFPYHCAAGPVPTHIANGMYGVVLVEPEEGLPHVDREFYVMQSEVYAEESETRGLLDYSYTAGLREEPMYVVFNGSTDSLTERSPLVVNQDERVRIYFCNTGPNLASSFHVIGGIFDKVYRDGDVISPPARGVSTTLVPPGGAAIVELQLSVPGNYTLVDHSIFRIEKGAAGFLKVRGRNKRRDIFDSVEPPVPCPGCKLHN